jgi:lipopolysaccharide export system protein LptC
MISTPARDPSGKTSATGEVWRPRAPAEAGEVGRYSKFVGAMRIALPATAAVLLLLVLVVPQFRGDDGRFRAGETPVVDAAVDALSMVNARYFGIDAKGQPYSITAKSVRERTGADKRIELGAPQADVTLDGGPWLSIEADSGLYDRDGDVLDLTGNVSLFQDQGYELHTVTATIRLKTGAATSRAPVEGQGPFGELTSAGFDLYDKGRVVVFSGPAHLVLNRARPKSTPDEAAP